MPSSKPSRRRAGAKALRAWYAPRRGAYPWRETRDPYAIWVSEVMLQQTTVGAVAPRYEAFLKRFPDVASLARAREDSVLAAWSGLGYYARARNLRRAALRIAAEHGGRIPAEPEALADLPGFGRYMSAAVACLAFDAPVPAADANVSRVLSRVFAIGGNGAARERAVLDRARELLPRSRPKDVLAAWMDLGQLVCTPRRPRCPECPIAEECSALALGAVDRYPARPAASSMGSVHLAAALVLRHGRALVERRRSGYLAGMWAFPLVEAKTARQARRALASRLGARRIRMDSGPPVGRATHTIMRRRLIIEIFRGLPEGDAAAESGERWIAPGSLELAATPTLTRKIAGAAGFIRQDGPEGRVESPHRRA